MGSHNYCDFQSNFNVSRNLKDIKKVYYTHNTFLEFLTTKTSALLNIHDFYFISARNLINGDANSFKMILLYISHLQRFYLKLKWSKPKI